MFYPEIQEMQDLRSKIISLVGGFSPKIDPLRTQTFCFKYTFHKERESHILQRVFHEVERRITRQKLYGVENLIVMEGFRIYTLPAGGNFRLFDIKTVKKESNMGIIDLELALEIGLDKEEEKAKMSENNLVDLERKYKELGEEIGKLKKPFPEDLIINIGGNRRVFLTAGPANYSCHTKLTLSLSDFTTNIDGLLSHDDLEKLVAYFQALKELQARRDR